MCFGLIALMALRGFGVSGWQCGCGFWCTLWFGLVVGSGSVLDVFGFLGVSFSCGVGVIQILWVLANCGWWWALWFSG